MAAHDEAAVHRRDIRIKNVSKTYPGTVALRGVDLELKAGEVHALLGANGCGKSTLVKILAGAVSPDPGGEIHVGAHPLDPGSPAASFDAGLRFVHQDLALVDDLSVGDNVMLTGGWPTRAGTIRSEAARTEVRAALKQLDVELEPDTLVADLSAVMRTIVAMTRAVRGYSGSEIAALVLDEPTATLPQHDVATLVRLVRTVASRGASVVIVSHHIQEVLEMADTVTVLRDGTKVLTAPAATLTRAEIVAAMMGDQADLEAEQSDATVRSGGMTDEVVLDADRLGGVTFSDVSLTVRSGEIVGVAGLEGSGRNELLRVIFGAQERLAGTVAVRGKALPSHDLRAAMAAGVAYMPGDRARSAAVPTLTGRENLTLADLRSVSSRGRLDTGKERAEAKRWFAGVGVKPENATEQPLSSFSGGNQQKIMLARWLRRAPSLLLLDEPTQGIDVGAQARLHGSLREAASTGAGILLSSSDELELSEVCHRVLVMRRGRIVRELTGAEVNPRSISNAAIGGGEPVAVGGGAR